MSKNKKHRINSHHYTATQGELCRSDWGVSFHLERLKSVSFSFHPSVILGSGTLPELSSLGSGHVLRSYRCGHASAPCRLHRPTLQLDVRWL